MSLMNYVTLAPGLPPSSRLGFGCGSIMGRVGRAESLRAIAAAFDAGITHFDVARLYGYGEAEALVGEALRGRRDRVVVASKFGLAVSRAAGALRGLKPLARAAMSRLPALRPLLRAAVGGPARGSHRFSPEAAKHSLDTSLAALGTDHLDILFLHDCAATDLTDELVDFLDRQVAAGTIRAYGAATDIEAVETLVRENRAGLVFQFANSVCARQAERLPPMSRPFVTHSPFLGAERLRARVAAEIRDGIDPARLHGLMLSWALAANPSGVVLCSMLDDRHRRANLAVAERSDAAAAEFAALEAVAAEIG
jgi:aryl-alcohol dehydrogenase-like predicted oxidoreductase